ncbi:hypothetical protein [Pseudomonas sp. LT1P18]|uniref:hypothetical protein n=1 Tax=Pseudomonas arabinosi TaxID=3398357 RepID=UPI0039EE63B0
MLEPPGFMRFLQQQAGFQKKNQQDSDLCTLVAFTPISPLKRPLEVEALRQIKTVAGLPDGDSNVSPRTLFTDAQTLKNNAKSCQPACIDAVNLRHLPSRLRQGRKEAERLDTQVSPTWSA